VGVTLMVASQLGLDVSEVGFDAHLALSHASVQVKALRSFGSFSDGDIAYDWDGPCDLAE